MLPCLNKTLTEIYWNQLECIVIFVYPHVPFTIHIFRFHEFFFEVSFPTNIPSCLQLWCKQTSLSFRLTLRAFCKETYGSTTNSYLVKLTCNNSMEHNGTISWKIEKQPLEVFCKKRLKISQISQENICVRTPILKKSAKGCSWK